jgi:hypothetical protein
MSHPQVPAGDDSPAASLTPLELEVLAFERQQWRQPAAKEQAIKTVFDMSATRYYQLRRSILRKPAAIAHDGQLVNRLLRLEQRGRQARTRAT